MILIAVPPKRVDLLLGILQGREPMDVQTLFAEPPVEGLDRRTLAAPTEVQHDAVSVRPQIHGRADKLGPVIAVDALRQPPLEPQALRVATTSRPVNPWPTSIAKHSRVNRSMTVKVRNRRP